MYKEWIISAVLIVSILCANAIAENKITKSVDQMNEKLNTIKQTMLSAIEENKKIDERNANETIEKQMKEIREYWNAQYSILAYFIEHDELEKVKTVLFELEGNIIVQDYEQAMPNLENASFILQHIKEKNKFMLRNIF